MTAKYDPAMLAAFHAKSTERNWGSGPLRLEIFAAGWNAHAATMPTITAARLDRAIDAAGPALAAATEIAEKMAACRERDRLVQVGALADDGVAVQREDGE